MKRRLALFLVLCGTFLAARTVVAWAAAGRSPDPAPLALHAVVVPLAQLAVLEVADRLRRRAEETA